MPLTTYDLLFVAFAFALGAAIGSFLNVCIYRMPRDKKVNDPPRSFCPQCGYQIPWWNNLPLFSWLILRGRCANCHQPIPFRYFGVEGLTALLFLAVWVKVGPDNWALAFPLWILVSLLIVATFIDFDFFIIPDEITWGGVVAGVVLSLAIPPLQSESQPLLSGLWSLLGAVVGFGLLWAVVQLGKVVFGKKMFRLDEPTDFSWTRIPGQDPAAHDSDADLVVGDLSWQAEPPPGLGKRLREGAQAFRRSLRLPGVPKRPARGEAWRWSELFCRPSDRLLIRAQGVAIDGEVVGDATLHFAFEELTVNARTWKLETTDLICGKALSLVVPREAMGFGDVKFIAAIGAFLGWQAVIFTVVAASMVGAVIGTLGLLLGRREWSAKIPFGPYLALGALGWIFGGPALLAWYWSIALPSSVP